MKNMENKSLNNYIQIFNKKNTASAIFGFYGNEHIFLLYSEDENNVPKLINLIRLLVLFLMFDISL